MLFIQNEMEEFAALLGTLASAKEAKRYQKNHNICTFLVMFVCVRVILSDETS